MSGLVADYAGRGQSWDRVRGSVELKEAADVAFALALLPARLTSRLILLASQELWIGDRIRMVFDWGPSDWIGAETPVGQAFDVGIAGIPLGRLAVVCDAPRSFSVRMEPKNSVQRSVAMPLSALRFIEFHRLTESLVTIRLDIGHNQPGFEFSVPSLGSSDDGISACFPFIKAHGCHNSSPLLFSCASVSIVNAHALTTSNPSNPRTR